MTAEEIWAAYRLVNPQIGEEIDAWQFGVEPDLLADLVLSGEKTATASAYELYEIEKEPLPQVGEFDVILNSRNEAICVIETTKVELCPFNQVSAEHAFKEGEGDKSLAYWRKVHEEIFTEWLLEAGLEFSPKSLVVLEEFKVVYPL
ncbi:ASCH domain-containing protein [Streptococcus respiraculi]|uniref:ASCH domain-containing protein n=1 Tax=Streptococcus respiraculi TaxID=2021971 RepID=UPI000E70748C|nr:ASCH domain-containing protein [Streptococcus respiraculi]